MVDQAEQTARCDEDVATFGATVFLRSNGADEAMQVVAGIVLL